MLDPTIFQQVRKLIASAYNYDEVLTENGITQDDVNTLRELSKSSEFVPRAMIDKILLMILVACDNDMDKSVSLLHSYCKFVKETPGFFANRDVDSKEVRSSLDNQYFISLPTTPNNCNLFFFKLSNSEPKKHNFDAAEKTFLMTVGELKRFKVSPKNEKYYSSNVQKRTSTIKVQKAEQFFYLT